MCALNFLLYLVGHLLCWVGLGEDSISQKLKRDFEDLKQKRQQQRDGTVTVTDTEDVLSAAKCRNKAGELIRDALEVLMREQPSAFQEARRSGSGPFIEILKVSADAGFRGENKKLLFENDITTAGNKFDVGADGCLLKKYSGACEYVISVDTLVAVPLRVDGSDRIVWELDLHSLVTTGAERFLPLFNPSVALSTDPSVRMTGELVLGKYK